MDSQEGSINKLEEFLEVVEHVPEDKIEEAMLIITGYISCYENMNKREAS